MRQKKIAQLSLQTLAKSHEQCDEQTQGIDKNADG